MEIYSTFYRIPLITTQRRQLGARRATTFSGCRRAAGVISEPRAAELSISTGTVTVIEKFSPAARILHPKFASRRLQTSKPAYGQAPAKASLLTQ